MHFANLCGSFNQILLGEFCHFITTANNWLHDPDDHCHICFYNSVVNLFVRLEKKLYPEIAFPIRVTKFNIATDALQLQQRVQNKVYLLTSKSQFMFC